MRVKMVDVARALGVSKATVSLAVNNKPGVNAETRQRILDYIEAKQQEQMRTQAQQEADKTPAVPAVTAEDGGIIKVLIINHQKQVVCDPELNLWSGVLETFDTECRRNGYMYSPSFLNDADSEEERSRVLAECNSDAVSGVILFGTEMSEEDAGLLAALNKPKVVYDYDVPGNQVSCIVIDNAMAVQLAVDRLAAKGAGKILYLANSKDIYNFAQRRAGFFDAMRAHGLDAEKSSVIPLGEQIEEITRNAVAYISSHPLPDAFIFENYQVSVGVLNALRHLKIRAPGQIRYIGIDEVAGYMGGGITLEQVRIPHEERAAVAFRVLLNEIREGFSMKVKVFASPALVEGMSV